MGINCATGKKQGITGPFKYFDVVADHEPRRAARYSGVKQKSNFAKLIFEHMFLCQPTSLLSNCLSAAILGQHLSVL